MVGKGGKDIGWVFGVTVGVTGAGAAWILLVNGADSHLSSARGVGRSVASTHA
jgi:hypothetical protein